MVKLMSLRVGVGRVSDEEDVVGVDSVGGRMARIAVSSLAWKVFNSIVKRLGKQGASTSFP